MTDNEIIKALEICGTYKGKCTDCPAYVKVDRSKCQKVLLGAVEIINRLQVENEELKSAINGFRGYEDKIKAEAYTEFFERLHKKLTDTSNGFFECKNLKACEVLQDAIDKLRETYKEMVGDGNVD